METYLISRLDMILVICVTGALYSLGFSIVDEERRKKWIILLIIFALGFLCIPTTGEMKKIIRGCDVENTR